MNGRNTNGYRDFGLQDDQAMASPNHGIETVDIQEWVPGRKHNRSAAETPHGNPTKRSPIAKPNIEPPCTQSLLKKSRTGRFRLRQKKPEFGQLKDSEKRWQQLRSPQAYTTRTDDRMDILPEREDGRTAATKHDIEDLAARLQLKMDRNTQAISTQINSLHQDLKGVQKVSRRRDAIFDKIARMLSGRRNRFKAEIASDSQKQDTVPQGRPELDGWYNTVELRTRGRAHRLSELSDNPECSYVDRQALPLSCHELDVQPYQGFGDRLRDLKVELPTSDRTNRHPAPLPSEESLVRSVNGYIEPTAGQLPHRTSAWHYQTEPASTPKPVIASNSNSSDRFKPCIVLTSDDRGQYSEINILQKASTGATVLPLDSLSQSTPARYLDPNQKNCSTADVDCLPFRSLSICRERIVSLTSAAAKTHGASHEKKQPARGEGNQSAQSPQKSRKRHQNGKGRASNHDLNRRNTSASEQSVDEHNGRTPGPAGDSQRRLACPFYQNDPQRYQSCKDYDLCTVSRLKQHIKRMHEAPPSYYCPRCYQSFPDRPLLDAHIRQADPCPKQPSQTWDCSEEQQKLLSKRISTKLSLQDQYNTVYHILFPGAELPKSPYLEILHSKDLQRLIEFSLGEGPAVLETLFSQSTQIMLPPDDDSRRMIRDITHLYLQRLFERWENSANSAGTQPDASATTRLSTSGTSEDPTQSGVLLLQRQGAKRKRKHAAKSSTIADGPVISPCDPRQTKASGSTTKQERTSPVSPLEDLLGLPNHSSTFATHDDSASRPGNNAPVDRPHPVYQELTMCDQDVTPAINISVDFEDAQGEIISPVALRGNDVNWLTRPHSQLMLRARSPALSIDSRSPAPDAVITEQATSSSSSLPTLNSSTSDLINGNPFSLLPTPESANPNVEFSRNNMPQGGQSDPTVHQSIEGSDYLQMMDGNQEDFFGGMDQIPDTCQLFCTHCFKDIHFGDCSFNPGQYTYEAEF